jgi:HD-like signal output (HDOD) protein
MKRIPWSAGGSFVQPAQIDTADFAAVLRNDIAERRIKLPLLPEVALQVRDAVEQDSATAAQIAQLIAQDVALSTRLLQVANSPRYRGRVEVDSIQMAVTRLGTKLVRSLVMSLAMRQIFQTSSSVLEQHFRRVWDDSVEVAAISHYFADDIPHLETEQAMLGGLLHNIGALPILARIEELGGDSFSDRLIEQLLMELAPEVGTLVMEAWTFPGSLAAVPRGCLDLQRDSGPQVDYVDVVLAARLQHLLAMGRIEMGADWARVPAFRKLGIQVEVVVLDEAGPATWIEEVRSVLHV